MNWKSLAHRSKWSIRTTLQRGDRAMIRSRNGLSCPRGTRMPKGGFSFEGGIDASGLRVAVVVARFNAHVTGPLYDGCRDDLAAHGLAADAVEMIEVPGCFELALVAKELGASGRFDAIICI